MKKLFLIAIVATLAGCQTQNNLFLGNTWKLVELNGKNISTENVEVTLNFDLANKKVNGNGGCNRYFGSYQLNGNSIEISNIGSTKMFCMETANIEDEFFNTLKDKSEIKVIGSQLTFSKEGKTVLIFQKGNKK
ncbi:MAG: META domain-containing protein [Paludibacteraceae bacterium]